MGLSGNQLAVFEAPGDFGFYYRSDFGNSQLAQVSIPNPSATVITCAGNEGIIRIEHGAKDPFLVPFQRHLDLWIGNVVESLLTAGCLLPHASSVVLLGTDDKIFQFPGCQTGSKRN